jgi:hypothetical protein
MFFLLINLCLYPMILGYISIENKNTHDLKKYT